MCYYDVWLSSQAKEAEEAEKKAQEAEELAAKQKAAEEEAAKQLEKEATATCTCAESVLLPTHHDEHSLFPGSLERHAQLHLLASPRHYNDEGGAEFAHD